MSVQMITVEVAGQQRHLQLHPRGGGYLVFEGKPDRATWRGRLWLRDREEERKAKVLWCLQGGEWAARKPRGEDVNTGPQESLLRWLLAGTKPTESEQG